MDVPLNTEITYFAKTNFRGGDQIFGIKRKDRRQHMYVLGKSGTGKSTLIENLIIQDIYNNQGVAVIDPHGDLVEKIIKTIPEHRVNDVIYFNPSDTKFHIGFNVLQVDDIEYKHVVASGLMGIFTKIWANAWSARMEYILNNSILALLDTPGTTLLGIPRLLVDKDYRQYIINNLKDPVIKTFWISEYETWRDQYRNEAIAPVQNKVGQFLSSAIIRNVVGQSKSTINLFDIMNQGKIFLVNVSKGRIGEDNSALMGAMLITKLQLAAMERVRIPEAERKDFYLYVDEFQNFVTDSFASILSEARKYRLCLTIAHQYTAQLSTGKSGTSAVKDAVFGNVGTILIFRVGAEDAKVLENEFKPEFDMEDFVTLPNYTIYVKLMVDGATSRPFSAATLPAVDVPNLESTEQLIIETSRSLYTRPRDEVEEEIHRWSSSLPGEASGGNNQTVAPGKFKAQCNNCKKNIFVPFEPDPSRPVYCKDCLLKIKNGEIKPSAGFRAPRDKDENLSYDSLALLGIEYTKPQQVPARSFTPAQTTPPRSAPQPLSSRPLPSRSTEDRRDMRTISPSRPPTQDRPRPMQSVRTEQSTTVNSAPVIRPVVSQQPPAFPRSAPSTTPPVFSPRPIIPPTPVLSSATMPDPSLLHGDILGEPLVPTNSPSKEMQTTRPLPPREERKPVSRSVQKELDSVASGAAPKQKGALQSVLKQALGSIVHKKDSTEEKNSGDIELKPKEEQPTISLSTLKASPVETQAVIKEAQLEKLATLRAAIEKSHEPVVVPASVAATATPIPESVAVEAQVPPVPAAEQKVETLISPVAPTVETPLPVQNSVPATPQPVAPVTNIFAPSVQTTVVVQNPTPIIVEKTPTDPITMQVDSTPGPSSTVQNENSKQDSSSESMPNISNTKSEPREVPEEVLRGVLSDED